MGPRTSSLQSPPAAALSYFDFQPSTYGVSPVKPGTPGVYTLDAFHQRPCTPFEYPPNAHIYAKRTLPPLPSPAAVPALRQSSSSESMCSTVPSRPCTSMSNRQSVEKALPPLPSHGRSSSLQSRGSTKRSSETESALTPVSRPRTGRSISFRGLLNRHSDEVDPPLPSPASSVCGTRDSRSDSLIGDLALTQVKTNGTTSSSLMSRRPSALSLGQIRTATKKATANPPALPSRPSSRKGSVGAHSQHRWGIFRTSDEDKEDIPPMPATPGFTQELSFTQCYYFYARNCNGYVLSNGSSGDACENCARSGFLGSP